MTVIFKNKYTDEMFCHEDVIHIQMEDMCFSTVGYGLHFIDNTYCCLSKEIFDLISAAQ